MTLTSRYSITLGLAVVLTSMLFPTSQMLGQEQSANPRETLKHYIADLQKSPDDQALREKIISLASTLSPKPAIPEEARRHFVKAYTLMREAKGTQEAGTAVEEYNKALLEAPWWADAYRDLGVALELAGRYEDARKALKLFLLTNPTEEEARKAQDEIYRIEAKQEKAGLAQAQADREKEKAEAVKRQEEQKYAYLLGTWRGEIHAEVSVDGRNTYPYSVQFSKDGGVIEGRHEGKNFLRGTIQDPDNIKWEYWRDEDPSKRFCPHLSNVWMPAYLDFSRYRRVITFKQPTYFDDCKASGFFITFTFTRD